MVFDLFLFMTDRRVKKKKIMLCSELYEAFTVEADVRGLSVGDFVSYVVLARIGESSRNR